MLLSKDKISAELKVRIDLSCHLFVLMLKWRRRGICRPCCSSHVPLLSATRGSRLLFSRPPCSGFFKHWFSASGAFRKAENMLSKICPLSDFHPLSSAESDSAVFVVESETWTRLLIENSSRSGLLPDLDSYWMLRSPVSTFSCSFAASDVEEAGECRADR